MLLLNCCLDFLLPKNWITQASNLEITKKIMATLRQLPIPLGLKELLRVQSKALYHGVPVFIFEAVLVIYIF